MDALKKIGVFRIVLIVIAGIVLVLCSIPLPEEKNSQEIWTEGTKQEETYEERAERRLKEMLESAAGIRSAEVMITWYCGSEKIIEREEQIQEEIQTETQADGRISQMSSKHNETSAILTEQKDGSHIPYVLKELSPVVQGILIVAEDITTEKMVQISEAVQALFGIEAHKVKVLEKKMQSEG